MAKQNCWEFKACGRQKGGNKAAELGICPACKIIDANGLNDGLNGGRICWAMVGTLCKGEVQGTFVEKFGNCSKCDFYLKVKEEEGIRNFKLGLPKK